MTPKEHVAWFYEKFKDGLIGHHSQEAINRQHLDQEQLINLIEEHNCKSVLEIGTWEGQTGLLLWLHPNVKKFKAIDIHSSMNVEYDNSMHKVNEVPIDFVGHYMKNTHTQIDFIDTMKWNPVGWQKENGHFDMIFIDANHDLRHVRNDTLKALELKPKIIVWHDVAHDEGLDMVPTFLLSFENTHPQYEIHKIGGTEIGYIVL